MHVILSDGQKLEAMKRLRVVYAEDLNQVEAKLLDALTAAQEAEFLAQYLGEQPEVKALRVKATESEALEKRRQYLGALIERLDQYTPKQPDVKAGLGSGAPPMKPAGLKRF
jgi:hypothetical protein